MKIGSFTPPSGLWHELEEWGKNANSSCNLADKLSCKKTVMASMGYSVGYSKRLIFWSPYG